MKHEMKLNDRPFTMMANGTKTVELRLNDEKRQQVKVGDTIVFQHIERKNEQLNVEVLERVQFDSFQELLKHYDNEDIGAPESYQLSQNLAELYQIYTQTDELTYGVVAFRVKLI